MGNLSRWTYSVILLCLSGITLSQRFPYENPSNGYRNAPSKLSLRNFLGSKLIQRLADNQNNAPQYESYSHHISSPVPCEQMVHPLPPPPQSLPPSPLSPSYSRGLVPYEYQNQRLPVQPSPQPMGSPRHLMSPSPSHALDSPAPHAMDQPPHLMGPPPQHVSQSNMHENVYTETITSSCPECEAANQDYSYQEEPCSCCEGGCPCPCEECPCCKGRGRCPCYSDDPSYPPEKEYSDRDQGYDDYPNSDCPCCCCDCVGNHECPCSHADEPQGPPQYRRERPNHRGYPLMKQMNENYMEGSDSQVQRESYHSMVSSSSNKPIPLPREVQQRRFQQYDEPMKPPQYVKMPPRRTFVPQPDMPSSAIHHAHISELPEESMHRHRVAEPVDRVMPHPHMPEPIERIIQHPHMPEPVERIMQHPHMPEPIERVMQHPHMPEPIERIMQHPHMPEPVERVMQQPHMPEMSDRTIHHTEITERGMHRFHEPAPPMPMPPAESCSMYQEGPRVRDWRPVRMPPSGSPRHMVEEENLHPEPPVPMYRNYQSVPNRYSRKYRQPSKPPFFDGLSYTDGC